MTTRIGVLGVAGRMGRALVQATLAAEGAQLTAAIDRPGQGVVGQDVGRLAGLDPLGLSVGDSPEQLFAACDVAIDFTAPAATAAHAAHAARSGCRLVVGTTGLSAAQDMALETASQHVALLQAPNMSLGVNLLLALVEQAARMLPADYDIEVLEMHHRAKVDAPSGTALALGRAAAAGRGIDLDAESERGRDGETGPRGAGKIGFAVLRGGDVPGDHTVYLAGPGERLEFSHKAGDRMIFAHGAVRAALWLADRPPGFYTMRDVLGLERPSRGVA